MIKKSWAHIMSSAATVLSLHKSVQSIDERNHQKNQRQKETKHSLKS